MQKTTPSRQIGAIYTTLADAWGPQHWWPARTPFDVIVGAYLTQNTNWTNVERALEQLRSAHVLSVNAIRRIPVWKLERLIRSSGYFRQEARRLNLFVEFLDRNYNGSLKKMFAQPTVKLLLLNGVGPETADSILLYAGQHPIFVIDAYTRRITIRHGLASEDAKYDDLRVLFEQRLSDTKVIDDARSLSSRGASHHPSRMSLARRTPLAQVF